MRLSKDRFFKNELITVFRVHVNGEDIRRNVTRYGYELTGTKGKIYDVDILEKPIFVDGRYVQTIYRINGVPYIEPSDIHLAIIEHYGLLNI